VKRVEIAKRYEAAKTSAARKTFEALKILEAVKTMYALKIAKTWEQASLRQTRHRLLNQWPSRWFSRSREIDTSAFGLAYWNLSCKPPTCLIGVSIH
jgi:hypothetical protein